MDMNGGCQEQANAPDVAKITIDATMKVESNLDLGLVTRCLLQWRRALQMLRPCRYNTG
jgi:hypothetical protein